MSIEFLCPTCSQNLRVPDSAAGKNAKCPKCSAILLVPGAGSHSSASSSPLAPPPQAGFNFGPPQSPPPPPPKSPAPGSPFGGPPSNPFADEAKQASATQLTVPAAPNPYASPQGVPRQYTPAPPGGIGHQIVDVSPVVNHAIKIWKENLGILMAITFIPLGVMIPFMVLLFAGMGIAEQADMPELAIVIFPVFYFALLASQVFFGIGQIQMCLKLARGQQVQLGEIIGGGERFLPVLGFSLLAGIALNIGILACVVPGVLLLLYFWPSYHLVIDRKCGVFDSFGIAGRITEGNKLTSFVLVLVSYGFMLLGQLACYVGMFFAMPLVMLLWVTAYLMMSGQLAIPQPPPLPQYYGPPASR